MPHFYENWKKKKVCKDKSNNLGLDEIEGFWVIDGKLYMYI